MSEIGEKFVRTDEYETKLFTVAIGKNVHKDCIITMGYLGNKIKAYCPKFESYIQFPRGLRRVGAEFVADLIEQNIEGKNKFYTAVKGSIRRKGSNTVVG